MRRERANGLIRRDGGASEVQALGRAVLAEARRRAGAAQARGGRVLAPTCIDSARFAKRGDAREELRGDARGAAGSSGESA